MRARCSAFLHHMFMCYILILCIIFPSLPNHPLPTPFTLSPTHLNNHSSPPPDPIPITHSSTSSDNNVSFFFVSSHTFPPI
ncbi:hypothetical protein EON63_19905, partial [archaeon]